jgi:Ca2+/Na+ antiporter
MNPSNPILHKPRSIIAGKNILYATICLGFINSFISEWMNTNENYSRAQRIVITLTTLLILFFLTREIALRKKWARMTFLILFIVGMLVFPPALIAMFNMNFLVGIFAVFQTLLQIVALIFLFSKESNLWFNSTGHMAKNK